MSDKDLDICFEIDRGDKPLGDLALLLTMWLQRGFSSLNEAAPKGYKVVSVKTVPPLNALGVRFELEIERMPQAVEGNA